MSETQLWKKVNDKKYQIMLDGEWHTIHAPYGKVEAVVTAFVDNGGMIDPKTGEVATDLVTLVRGFGKMGDILLSEYDEAGRVAEQKYCRGLAAAEIMALFQISTDIVSNFMDVIFAAGPENKMTTPQQEPAAKAKSKAKS